MIFKYNIYIIANAATYQIIRQQFQGIPDDRIILLDKGDIYSFTQLFNDSSEKILAIEPTVIDWKLPTEALSKISNLKGICTSSAWAGYIDFEYCKSNNIIVTKTIGANSQSVAEYAIWMMFSLARQLPLQMNNNWKSDIELIYHTELFGETLGIVGFGNIGSRIAAMGKGLGMQVQYWNRSTKQTEFKSISLEELFSSSDVIINCLDITDETQGKLNKSLISLMKQSAFFVSVLGGLGWGVQDDQYLLEMVATGKLAGFAVENEHKGLWETRYKGNVFIPTARAHHTKEAEERVNQQWVDGISSIINNTPTHLKVAYNSLLLS